MLRFEKKNKPTLIQAQDKIEVGQNISHRTKVARDSLPRITSFKHATYLRTHLYTLSL